MSGDLAIVMRVLVCNAVCVVLTLPVIGIVAPMFGDPVMGLVASVLFFLWIILAVPLLWAWLYRVMGRNGAG